MSAVAVGGAVTYAGARVKTKRGYGAGVEAWNTLCDAEDPAALDTAAFASVRERYGQSPEVTDGLKKAYSAYLMVRSPCIRFATWHALSMPYKLSVWIPTPQPVHRRTCIAVQYHSRPHLMALRWRGHTTCAHAGADPAGQRDALW